MKAIETKGPQMDYHKPKIEETVADDRFHTRSSIETLTPTQTRMWTHTFIGDQCVDSNVIVSGPTPDVEDFFYGRITWEEFTERFNRRFR